MSMISKGQDCFIFWSRFSQIYFLKLWRPQAYSGQGLVYIAIALIKQILHLDYKKNQHITKRWSIHFPSIPTSEYSPPLNASVFPFQSILTCTLVATAIVPRLPLLVMLSMVFTVIYNIEGQFIDNHAISICLIFFKTWFFQSMSYFTLVDLKKNICRLLPVLGMGVVISPTLVM